MASAHQPSSSPSVLLHLDSLGSDERRAVLAGSGPALPFMEERHCLVPPRQEPGGLRTGAQHAAMVVRISYRGWGMVRDVAIINMEWPGCSYTYVHGAGNCVVVCEPF